MIKYSATEHACYDTDLKYTSIPDDLIEITEEEHQKFMGNNTPDGKQIVANVYPFEFEDVPELEPSRYDLMIAGFEYNGYQVSVTAEDGSGVLQVKGAFELGLTDTVIHFANGTEMPITSDDFAAFALAFVTERNSYFVSE